MFDHIKHKVTLIEILKDIYSDPNLRTVLGFKGGTAAMMFYSLPRMSVDLDFDLLQEDKKERVFEKIKAILDRHGTVYDAVEKHFTLFFVLSYGKEHRNVKIDISKRSATNIYEVKSYFGISMFVMKKEDMIAGKLAALLSRKKFAMRDVFDLWFFLKNKWDINEQFLRDKIDVSLSKALDLAIKKVSGISENELLQGLGELLDEKQKKWVKDKLVEETIFYLRLYKENLK